MPSLLRPYTLLPSTQGVDIGSMTLSYVFCQMTLPLPASRQWNVSFPCTSPSVYNRRILDDDVRVAEPDVGLPGDLRAAFECFRVPAGFGRDAVAVCSAPSGPARGLSEMGRGEDEKD